jgi:hypothetical protein
MFCSICNKSFRRPSRFIEHCTRQHGCPRARVAATVKDWGYSRSLVLATISGRPALMVTPPLL